MGIGDLKVKKVLLENQILLRVCVLGAHRR